MTYHADFEKALKQMDGWVKGPVEGKAVIYAGTLENTAGEIKTLELHSSGQCAGLISKETKGTVNQPKRYRRI